MKHAALSPSPSAKPGAFAKKMWISGPEEAQWCRTEGEVLIVFRLFRFYLRKTVFVGGVWMSAYQLFELHCRRFSGDFSHRPAVAWFSLRSWCGCLHFGNISPIRCWKHYLLPSSSCVRSWPTEVESRQAVERDGENQYFVDIIQSKANCVINGFNKCMMKVKKKTKKNMREHST